MSGYVRLVVTCVVAAATGVGVVPAAAAPSITRVLPRVPGIATQPVFDGMSSTAVSGDGRYVVAQGYFAPRGNRADPAPWQLKHLFLYDRATKRTTLVTRGFHGRPASPVRPDSDASRAFSISANGWYVAFMSQHDDLVRNDPNRSDTGGGTSPGVDLFVYDVRRGRTVRVPVVGLGDPATPVQRVRVTNDGKWVFFDFVPSDLTNNNQPVVVRRVSVARGLPETVSISPAGETIGLPQSVSFGTPSWKTQQFDVTADGRYVTFLGADAMEDVAAAVPHPLVHDLGKYSYTHPKVYVRDLVTKRTFDATAGVPTNAPPLPAPADRDAPATTLFTDPHLDDTGTWLAFSQRPAAPPRNRMTAPNDEPQWLWLRNLKTGELRRVDTPGAPVRSAGLSGNGAVLLYTQAAGDVTGSTSVRGETLVEYRVATKSHATRLSPARCVLRGTPGDPVDGARWDAQHMIDRCEWNVALSSDGRVVAFTTLMRMTADDADDGWWDLFVAVG